MSATPIAGLILAAGLGTRMKSALPKGLHQVCGSPMVQLVADAMRAAGVEKIVVVIGHGGDKVMATLGDSFEYAWQHEQLGTGHAVMCAGEALSGFEGSLIVAPGDTPLVNQSTFAQLISEHRAAGAACTVATANQDDPTGYGRIIRDANGQVKGIVEQKDANPEQKAIKEVNAGIYVLETDGLFASLKNLKAENSQKEYYFTDIIGILNSQGKKVAASVAEDPDILIGINDRWQLADANQKLRLKLIEAHARAGVTFIDPQNTYIGSWVQIGPDTIIEPGCHLYGKTKIGRDCQIGPGTRLIDTIVGDESLVIYTNAVSCEIGSDVKVGPFANIRPKSKLGSGVNIGNFVEINRSELANDVKARHLTYIGDSYIGEGTNIGAGTITCNYDGFDKHKTTVGKNAFIGSNSTLVAPLNIGDGAMLTAGSVITEDVPSDGGAFGRARQVTKEGWAEQFRQRKLDQSGGEH